MKRVLFFLLAFAIGVVLALAAFEDPGFMVFGRGTWSVESSLSVFLISLLLLFFLFYMVLRLLGGFWRVPQRLHELWSGKRQAKAQYALTQGCGALLEEEWHTAEQIFTRTKPGFLHYMGAAWAARQSGSIERAEAYLVQAAEFASDAQKLSVDLLRVKFYLDDGRSTDALGFLHELYKIRPTHPYILKLLSQTYICRENWQALYKLLPELRKRKTYDEAGIKQLETRSVTGLLTQAIEQGPQQADHIWSGLLKLQRLNPAVLQLYVKHLLEREQDKNAAELLREGLKHHWDAELLKLYSRTGDDAAQQLNQAEKWLKDHPADPVLLLVLGCLCTRNRLWGKARQYLERSLGLQERPETYQALGELQKQIGEDGKAAEYYLQGLKLATNKCVECP